MKKYVLKLLGSYAFGGGMRTMRRRGLPSFAILAGQQRHFDHKARMGRRSNEAGCCRIWQSFFSAFKKHHKKDANRANAALSLPSR
jgi:hypothetical protein